MEKSCVSVVTYEKPIESVARAVEMCKGRSAFKKGLKVFIKPNIVFWTRQVAFPKWGVITTSRVIEDMVILLKDCGIDDITIGEGVVTRNPGDRETPTHAFQTLGYDLLKKRYGIKYVNVMERGFCEIDLGDDIILNFNQDALDSDLIVDLPVLKAHNQTMVSLGIKNLKGLIDINSRKKCHSPDPTKDLHYHVARLADKLPKVFTLIDGIYSLERGPGFDGKMHRKNLLIASTDIFAADKVGAKILGFDPSQIPHLVHAAKNHDRPLDFSDVEIAGLALDDISRKHEYDFPYQEDADGALPVPLAKQGIKGIYYRKYDTSMCTYCSGVNGVVLTAIRSAWTGDDFDKIEVLTGKMMTPTKGMNKTILLGKCMFMAHRKNPDIKEMIPVKGCPPDPDDIVNAFHKAGIPVDAELFKHIDQLPGFFMARYKDRPEYDESFFRVE
ncbi:MAG: DUF362 domain-containing protein [Proteobacteria bacterium]|nr:DUF362 domain-containing protein [Pseudomonadota bacterium]MBU1582981.1 DUF362 domain-containing protein [Pseudomonadota bacterium]MBU2631774.1 DUF362 domain-containing protein [Pseudomonadota bacterium]